MINSQELLSKFSAILGIPATESCIGFEIFINQLCEKLSFGDMIEIGSLGFFAYKKVRTELTSNDNFIPLMIFSANQILDKKEDHLIFFLSEKYSEEFPSVDSFLNLSFGKPIIIPEKFSDELPLPISHNQLINLMESKVERLIASGKIYECPDSAKQVYDVYSEELEEKVKAAAEVDESFTEDAQTELDMELEKNTTLLNDEAKIENNVDDYELVKPEGEISSEVSSVEGEAKNQMFFNDFEFQTKSSEPIKEIEIENGYAEISDNLLKSTISELENINPGLKKSDIQASKSKARKRILRKLVFSILTLVILTSITAGVYLNYEKIKEILNTYLGNDSEVVEVKQRISPRIINRTYEIPITFPYAKDFTLFGQMQDSMLVSPAIVNARFNEFGLEFLPNKSNLALTSDNLVEVRKNIFQSGSEFVVQVSSWKSKSKTEEELKKYTESGYNAELLEASSVSVGDYFRVMVRGFNSINEANNFLNKQK